MKNIIISIAIIILSSFSFASESVKLQKAPIDLDDTISLQRGARNFVNYCLNCHSASYMRYNRLTDIGLTEELIKDNLLFTSDKVGDPMAISMKYSDAKKWFGAAPPNLSVTARSRGADWIYSYLRSFYRDPSRNMGWNNTVYKNSAMPHILWELQGEQHINHETNNFKLVIPGKLSPKEYDQFIGDITNYMVFMSEPGQQKRRQMGYYVLAFLFLLLVLTINLKKEYWKNIK
ncbi:MAG: cytochrome c1 [Methylophilaceae bacterium]|nr:cytochrome c1 [Methylophilaceae bacterium]